MTQLRAQYVSEDVRTLNPDVFGEQPSLPQGTPPEEQFLELWQTLTRIELEREYRFYPGRKWRADFAHVGTRTLIEIEGGQWVQGRHNRPLGYAADCEKYNHAAELGWRIFRLTPDMIDFTHVQMIVRSIQTGGRWG